MKRLSFLMVALTIVVSIASCGGSEKSREDKIREKAAYIVREAAKASANQDWDRLQEIYEEEREFTRNFSEKELEIYNEAAVDAGSDLLKSYL